MIAEAIESSQMFGGDGGAESVVLEPVSARVEGGPQKMGWLWYVHYTVEDYTQRFWVSPVYNTPIARDYIFGSTTVQDLETQLIAATAYVSVGGEYVPHAGHSDDEGYDEPLQNEQIFVDEILGILGCARGENTECALPAQDDARRADVPHILSPTPRRPLVHRRVEALRLEEELAGPVRERLGHRVKRRLE